MCSMEKRKLTIASHLAYGDKGVGDVIPPGIQMIKGLLNELIFRGL